LKILAVCGMGLGSALLIRMTIERVAKSMGIDAVVETADIGTARGSAMDADIVVTSGHLAERLGEIPGALVIVKNLMSEDEVTEKLTEVISNMS
jgi:PTS system ascorbate-specific IIB component